MSEFKFFDYITEGKMIRNSDGVSRMTFTDASDLVLLYFLALHVMRHYPSRRYVTSYSEQVLKWQNWHNFRPSANDLHCLLNIVDGDERIVEKLKDPKAAMRLRKRSGFPTLTAKRLLRSFKDGVPSIADAGDLLKIDSGLRNSRYSGLRRRIANYSKLTPNERRKAVTELENALKARGTVVDESAATNSCGLEPRVLDHRWLWALHLYRRRFACCRCPRNLWVHIA